MTIRKINARDLIVQVLAADGTTWLGIGGLSSITPKPDDGEAEVDTTTYDSQGVEETEKMQRGFSIDMEGFELKDATTGALDPGQARCVVLAQQVGYASLGGIRFRHPVDSLWKVWASATFKVGESGGDQNSKSGFKLTVKRSGPSTTAAAP
jgi:hypothetical protein